MTLNLNLKKKAQYKPKVVQEENYFWLDEFINEQKIQREKSKEFFKNLKEKNDREKGLGKKVSIPLMKKQKSK